MGPASKKPEPPSQKELERTIAWVNLFTAIIDRVGWPGLAVVSILAMIFGWASADQKRQIIDLYVLGKGIGGVWSNVALGAIFAAAVVAQARVYGRKIALLEKELERVGNEKSELQQELTSANLNRSSKPKGSKTKGDQT
jgi:hypothetical protein